MPTLLKSDSFCNSSLSKYSFTIHKNNSEEKTENNIKVDTVKIKTEKNSKYKSSENIENPERDYFLSEDLTQPAMFKNNRGKYRYMSNLQDYISSEFKPSNLKEKYDGNFVCYFTFFINPDGTISEVFPIGYNNKPEIQKEVSRIIEGMAGWKAGENEKHEKVLTKINFIFKIEIENKNPFPNF